MAALNNLWMGQPRETMVSSMLAIARLLLKCGCSCMCFNAPLFERQSQRLTTRSCQGPLVASNVAQCSVLRGLFARASVAQYAVLSELVCGNQCCSALGPAGPLCPSPVWLSTRSCRAFLRESVAAHCSVLSGPVRGIQCSPCSVL